MLENIQVFVEGIEAAALRLNIENSFQEHQKDQKTYCDVREYYRENEEGKQAFQRT